MNHRHLRKLNLDSLNRRARAVQKGEPFLHGCTGKARYATPEQANDRKVEIKTHDPSARVRVYKCVHCNEWHVTGHKPKKKRRAR